MDTSYVYVLLCSDGFTYTGITNNLSRRFEEHQRGLNKGCFTYSRRPVKLIFYQDFIDIDQAIAFEKKLKKWSRKKKLALAQEDYHQLKRLSECRNQTHFKK